MRAFLVGEGWGSYDLRKICLDRDVEILGYIDPARAVTLRSKVATVSMLEASKGDFDWVIISNPQFAACHQQLLDLGVPASAILVFYQDVPASMEKLGRVRNLSIRKRGTTDQYVIHHLQGKVTRDFRTTEYGPKEASLAAALLNLFLASREALDAHDPIYQVGRNWGGFLKSTRAPLHAAVQARDLRAIHDLLANFWRNGLGEGIIGGETAYRAFARTSDAAVNAGIEPYLCALTQGLGENVEPEALALPLTGNPFGIGLDGQLVQENSIMNYFRAVSLSRLLENREAPVVAEIGGGVGFFARALLKQDARITYIDFDLPEVLIVEACVLAKEFPDLRMLYFDGSMPRLTRSFLASYDIVLMPTCMLPQLDDASVDLFVNTISFGEMNRDIAAHFMREIQRTSRGFFYHENLCELNYDYENYATDLFQIPESFKLVASAPSRWPMFGPNSTHHAFTENLFVKRGQVF